MCGHEINGKLVLSYMDEIQLLEANITGTFSEASPAHIDHFFLIKPHAEVSGSKTTLLVCKWDKF
jgi:hypothetical protein